MSTHALFAGLITTPEGHPVSVAQVGGQAQYVVTDGDFRFHLDAEQIDRAVLRQLNEHIQAHREAVTEGALKMIGRDDVFTKAMVDTSLNHMEANFDQLIAQGLPEETQTYLGMLGFRITINHHGEVLSVDQPGMIAPEDE